MRESVRVILGTLKLLNIDYEIIFVDDASDDGTPEIIRGIVGDCGDGRLRAVFHPRNRGRGAAFLSGAEIARGEIVGFFDVDLEISPTYLISVLAKLNETKSDLVLGRRVYAGEQRSIKREVLSRSYSLLSQRLLRIPRELDTESGYKFFRRDALWPYVRQFLHSDWFWDTEVVSRFVWDGRPVSSVPVLFNRNASKASTVRPFWDSLRYLRALRRFRKHAPFYRSVRELAPRASLSASVVALLFFLLVFAGRAEAGYGKRVPGFGLKAGVDQGHFAEVGQLDGCQNAAPGKLFRGGVPNFKMSNALDTLKANQVQVVVDLRAENSASRRLEEATLLKNGIGYVNVPLNTQGDVPEKLKIRIHLPNAEKTLELETIEGLDTALELVRSNVKSGSNVYVHCLHGEDRTGIFVGLFRDCPAWKKEFRSFGGTLYPVLGQIFERAQARVPMADFSKALEGVAPQPASCER